MSLLEQFNQEYAVNKNNMVKALKLLNQLRVLKREI